MKRYVMGFAWTGLLDRVLLSVSKNRDDGSFGVHNGIGGPIIPSDWSFWASMVRVFSDATSIHTAEDDWRWLGRLENDEKVVELFVAVIPAETIGASLRKRGFSKKSINLISRGFGLIADADITLMSIGALYDVPRVLDLDVIVPASRFATGLWPPNRHRAETTLELNRTGV